MDVLGEKRADIVFFFLFSFYSKLRKRCDWIDERGQEGDMKSKAARIVFPFFFCRYYTRRMIKFVIKNGKTNNIGNHYVVPSFRL